VLPEALTHGEVLTLPNDRFGSIRTFQDLARSGPLPALLRLTHGEADTRTDHHQNPPCHWTQARPLLVVRPEVTAPSSTFEATA
jgi:hypothetical protein